MNLRHGLISSLVRRVRSSPVVGLTIATALSQIFPLLSAPILSRLYSPAAFGSYAIYFAVSTVLSTLALVSLHNAILLEQDDDAAFIALCTALLPPILFSCALFAVLLMTYPHLTMDFLAGLDALLLFVPATVTLSALYLAGYTWLLRMRRYRTLALNKVVLAVSTMLLQVGIGFFQLETLGFIVANLAGYVFATVLVFSSILRYERPRLRFPSAASIANVLSKHRASVMFTTPASLVNAACSYLPDFFVARLFGATVLGHYSLGTRMVSAPLGFISATVQDLFRSEAAREHASTGGCYATFRKYLLVMSVVSAVVLAPLIWTLPSIFKVMFGEVWISSGVYVQCLAVLLIIRFISSPLSYVWIVARKQHFDMAWQIGLLALAAGSFVIPEIILGPLSPETQFRIYSGVVGAWYALALFLSYHWARTK